MTPERLNEILKELQDFKSKEDARIESLYEGGLVTEAVDLQYLDDIDWVIELLGSVSSRYDTEGGG